MRGLFFMGELILYVKWVCLLPLSFVMAVVGRVLAPILPFFAKSDGYLLVAFVVSDA